jgi:transposase-like protein
MTTREATAEYRLAQWAQIIQDRTESGETISAYCESRGISRSSYIYWLRKVRNAACERLPLNQNGLIQAKVSGFAEVRIANQSVQPSQRESEPFVAALRDHVCIESSGVRISAGGDYSEIKLAVLLREVMRTC